MTYVKAGVQYQDTRTSGRKNWPVGEDGLYN